MTRHHDAKGTRRFEENDSHRSHHWAMCLSGAVAAGGYESAATAGDRHAAIAYFD